MKTDWAVVPLGELIDVRHGFAFKGEHFTDQPGPVVMTPGNFRDEGGFKFKSPEKYYSGPIPEGYVLSAGDLLVAMTEQKRGLLGSAALIPTTGVFLHNQRLGLVLARAPDKTCPRFLYYLFNAPYVRNQIQATASGVKVRHTSPTRLQDVEVRLPPPNQQEKIAAVLAAYDELIENNLRRIEILEEMAQAVYREWFVNFRYPGHENVPLVDSPLGLVPESWEVGEFGMVAGHVRVNINPERVPDEEFDHYSFAAFDGEQTASAELGSTMKSGKLLVDRPSVLLAKLNPRIPRVWFARPAHERRSIASSEFLVLRSRPGTPLEYLYAICSDPNFQARIAKMAGGTSTSHQRLKVEDLIAQPHVIPEERIRKWFGDQIGPMYELRENLIRQNANLREARDLLLPKLVSGEIDVSGLDIDAEWLAS